MAAPPTPDSAAGGLARLESLLNSTKTNPTGTGIATPERLSSSSDTSKPGLAPPKYTRSELIWLHRNYRGELPFLRAWGLDISSAEDRAEGLEMLRELMLEEEEEGGTRGGHERSGSKGSLAGSWGGMSGTGEIEVGFQHHQGEGQ